MVVYINKNYDKAVPVEDVIRELAAADRDHNQLSLHLEKVENVDELINYLANFTTTPIETIEVYHSQDRKNLIASYVLNAKISTLREYLANGRIISAVIDY